MREEKEKLEKLKEYLKIDEITILEDGDLVFESKFIDEFVKENEKLKAENEVFKEKFKRFFNIDNQECWDTAFLKDENAKYEQAFDEIEKTIKNCCCTKKVSECFLELSCPDCGRKSSTEIVNDILDIINKAKESE